jgi:signal transduction histidine kinase
MRSIARRARFLLDFPTEVPMTPWNGSDAIAPRAAGLERGARFFAVLVATIGVVVLLGWAGEDSTLKSVHATLVAMNPVTAAAFLLAAASLFLSANLSDSSVARRFAGVLAVTVVAIAALRLLGYVGPDVGVDRLLFSDRLNAEAIPNRMAPNTAGAFLLSGFALLGLYLPSRRAAVASQVLSLFVLAIALVTLCGYAYHSASLVRVREFIPMALHTAFGFAILSGGILCARPRGALFRHLLSDETGSRMARKLLFAAIGIPFVLGWLRVRAESAGLFDSATGAALMAVTWIAILGAMVWWQARALNRADATRTGNENRIAALNRELQHRATEVEATNRELEAFSYSVSHDLRAPLRSITSFSQALLEDCADMLDERGRDYLERVVRGGHRMAELIEDVMILSRITRAEMERTAVDMSAAANEIVTDLSESEPHRVVEVQVQPGLVAEGDPKLLRIAIANLLGNAWKFTARATRPCIEFGALPGHNGERVFFVRDNGAGFDMQHAERLFGPFQRLHTEAEFTGTGVGLATVQRVVRRHGGRIWAQSAVSKGAAFFFTVCNEGGHR